MSVHIEIFALGQGVVKKLEEQDGKNIQINTVV